MAPEMTKAARVAAARMRARSSIRAETSARICGLTSASSPEIAVGRREGEETTARMIDAEEGPVLDDIHAFLLAAVGVRAPVDIGQEGRRHGEAGVLPGFPRHA